MIPRYNNLCHAHQLWNWEATYGVSDPFPDSHLYQPKQWTWYSYAQWFLGIAAKLQAKMLELGLRTNMEYLK